MAGKRLKLTPTYFFHTLPVAVPLPRSPSSSNPLAATTCTPIAVLCLYCLMLLAAFQLVDAVADPGDAELFFGATVGGQIIVGIVVVALLAFITFHVRRSTCQWRKTRTIVRETAQSRRNSKWRVVRLFQLYIELRGPNSLW